MKFDDIWNQLCRKQPKLGNADSVVEFKSGNLKALLRQVYEQGQKSANDANQRQASGPFDPFKSMFG